MIDLQRAEGGSSMLKEAKPTKTSSSKVSEQSWLKIGEGLGFGRPQKADI